MFLNEKIRKQSLSWRSLWRWNKPRTKYHTSKSELSVWFIQLSTYFYHTVRFTTNQSFQYIYIYICVCVCVCLPNTFAKRRKWHKVILKRISADMKSVFLLLDRMQYQGILISLLLTHRCLWKKQEPLSFIRIYDFSKEISVNTLTQNFNRETESISNLDINSYTTRVWLPPSISLSPSLSLYVCVSRWKMDMRC